MSVTDNAIRCLFGTDELRPSAIIVPISRIYARLTNELHGKQSSGWYRCFHTEKATIIKSHPGNSVIDVAYAAGCRSEKIIHLGYCGGMGNAKIGDIVIASGAAHVSDAKDYIACRRAIDANAHEIAAVPVLTVNSMLLDESPENLRGFGAVDMETYWLFKFSPVPSSSLMVTTDLPGREFFYDVNPEDPRLKRGIDNLACLALGML
ncbi:MAG: hypothetical protein J4400_05000 [Candidatus Aenigmarchaeota archaeon]|nr:hypothetical protein [Candidatus Aenigmarchaeota archaeon]